MRWLLVVGLLISACKRTDAPALPVPEAPPSTTDQDALWKLAPDGLAKGVVASSRGLGLVERGFLSIQQLLTTSPELASVARELDAEIKKALGRRRFTLADLGMSSAKGFALFERTDGVEVLILPVVDRARFRGAFKGLEAADGDLVGDHICKTIRDVYACSKSSDALSRLGNGLGRDAHKVAGARGDIELVADVEQEVLGRLEISVVAQLARGSVVLRGGIRGLPSPTRTLVSSGKQAVDANKAVALAVLNLAPVLAQVPVPAADIIPGVTRDAVARSLDGPITMWLGPEVTSGEGRIPLKDPLLANRLVAHCDSLDVLDALDPTVRDGKCQLVVPHVGVTLDASSDAHAILIRQKGALARSASLPATPLATEFASGAWALAVYGRGSLHGLVDHPSWLALATPERVRMGLRALMMVNELGVGVRADGDILRFVVGLRTAWANADDVVVQLLAISPVQVMQGKAAAVAKSIATKFPHSPFATDLRGGVLGLVVPGVTMAKVAELLLLDDEDAEGGEEEDSR